MEDGNRRGYMVFETALGWVGIAWSTAGLTRLRLPERDRTRIARRMAAGFGDDPAGAAECASPPPRIAAAVEKIRRYAEGEPIDFSDVPVDLGPIDEFRRAVYAAARKLGYGETATYGGLAAAAGHPGLARETGEALGKNPLPLVIPCHRIVAAGGKLGGFSAPGGAATKERMLRLEGALTEQPPPAQQSFSF